jgi:uncharacterized membrane protein YciS (DUF1049 family)
VRKRRVSYLIGLIFGILAVFGVFGVMYLFIRVSIWHNGRRMRETGGGREDEVVVGKAGNLLLAWFIFVGRCWVRRRGSFT